MHERNPYAPPTAAVQDVVVPEPPRGDDAALVPYGRRRPVTHGAEWVVTSWYIYKQRPGLWILATFLTYAILIALSLVPVVNLLIAVSSPLVTAGFAHMAHAGYRGERYGLRHMLGGLERHTRALLVVGVCFIAAPAVCTATLMVIDDPVWLQIALGRADPVAIEGRLLTILAYSLAVSLVGMLLLFAPVLVFLNGVRPIDALKMSASGVLKNVLPGLLCAATVFGLFVLSILTLGLGLLVTFPMMFITMYCAYRDIFLAPAAVNQPSA